MEVQTLQIFAGSISSMLFITGNVPMLLKAYRTKDLRSYSLSHMVLVNTGNCLYWFYLSSLPVGPIWLLHSFYTLTMALLLVWYLRYQKQSTDYREGASESTMLKIGEFSRISRVTVKTLHHYDEIGLFKPSQVDPFTDYRYYTLDQLPRIHSIMALKELGLSLEEIGQLLLQDLPPEQIRGMLRLKRVEAQQHIHEEQARLAQIEFHLRQMEMEGRLQTADILIKPIEPFYALTLRRIARTRAEREVVARAHRDGYPTGPHPTGRYAGEYLLRRRISRGL